MAPHDCLSTTMDTKGDSHHSIADKGGSWPVSVVCVGGGGVTEQDVKDLSHI